jgi:hypothetical protein
MKVVCYNFIEIVDKYMLVSTTNKVEMLNSIRRYFADKRINYSHSFTMRSNLSLLSRYVGNWREVVLQR